MAGQTDALEKLQKLATRALPAFLLDRLDVVASTIIRQVEQFARSLPPEAAVLDAGAGEARFRSSFSRQRYVALDHRKGDPAWDYTRLDVVGDLLDLPLREGSFDAVLNLVVLEHTPDPPRVARELYRVLRASGRMLLVVPHIWEVHQPPNDYFRFTRYGLETILAAAGFEVTSLVPVGGYFCLLGRYSFYFLKFWRSGFRSVFLPLLAPFFGFFIPLLCYYLDSLDRTGKYAQAYVCEARKPR